MSGIGDQVKGAVKETLGKFTGNSNKEQEGHQQRAQGLGEQQLSQQQNESSTANKAASSAKQAGGTAQEKIGQAVGNEDMQKAGRQARAQGLGEHQIQDQDPSN
ncbi:hypothetical protein EV175_005888 [Coemansia sp. RSA 1933]|nr:hypothetical protein EV175_005888 [Coemansia sp. RSA 1933]